MDESSGAAISGAPESAGRAISPVLSARGLKNPEATVSGAAAWKAGGSASVIAATAAAVFDVPGRARRAAAADAGLNVAAGAGLAAIGGSAS